MKSDSELSLEVKKTLELNLESSVLDIQSQVEKGVAYLDGVVDTLADKEFAEEIITHIPDVKDVVNHLSIGMERHVKENDLINAVEESLIKKDEKYRRIGIAANKGVVHIYGDIDNVAEEKDIINASMEVQGVKEVTSHLRLKGNMFGEPIDDATLQNRIIYNFSTDYDVDRAGIKVSVQAGVAHLSGIVQNQNTIRIATDLAQKADGVRSVVSNIQLIDEDLNESENPELSFVTRDKLSEMGRREMLNKDLY